MEKKWIFQEAPAAEFIAAHPELPPLVARLLWNRGQREPEKITSFLNPNYARDVHDPFLFNDMEKAVKIIFDCIKLNKKIVVHGDYDADGVCASAIIMTTLKKLGAAHTDTFLPHRELDGYGLNKRTVQMLKDSNTELIITCDCGISNTEEVAFAKELGMQVIITDHHAMPAKFPPADAIIHPLVPNERYPDKTLAGGGVAFKLIQALLKRHHETNELMPDGQTHEAFEKWLLDLASISTVGDMVPLIGESRALVRYGLTVLNKTHNLGLQKLFKQIGLIDETGKQKRVFDTQTIGFQIAPRINAAGRMDHANVAYALLMAETEEEAVSLAAQLDQNNVDRQKLTDQLVAEARQQIKDTNQSNNPILYTFGETWATGILGLIASRIKEEFYKPVLAMGINGGTVTGSGRSVPGFNLIEALKTMPEFFHKFGGHPQACGFSLKNREVFEDFKKTLLGKAAEGTKQLDLSPQIKIDALVDLEEINWDLYNTLQKFEPFGMGNDEPLYAATDLTVMGVDSVGQDGKHLRILVKHNSHVVKKTIAFGFGNKDRHPANWRELVPGTKIDLAFTVSVNEWKGNRDLQLMIQDIKRTETNQLTIPTSKNTITA